MDKKVVPFREADLLQFGDYYYIILVGGKTNFYSGSPSFI